MELQPVMFTPGSTNYIDKLRIVGEVDDSLAFQLRLQSLLSSADFSVLGLSPAAVVCIRSVADPRPQTLRLVRGELEGARIWSEALTQSLAGKVSRAARPANGRVPSNAESIVFADKAEMLACLASDWLSGLLWTRWWWKILLPVWHSSVVIEQLWRDHPQYVPAALDQLERQNKAASFVSVLTDDHCRELIQQIVLSFAIQHLKTVCQVSLPISHPNLNEGSIGSLSGPDLAAPTFGQKVFTAPWAPWVGESTAGVSPERQRFLGVALTIARAPSYARTKEFARALGRWQEEVANGTQNVRTLPRVKQANDESRLSSVPAVAAVPAPDTTLQPSTQSPVLATPENEARELTRDFHSHGPIEAPPAKPFFSDTNPAAEPHVRAAVLDADPVGSIAEGRSEFEMHNTSAEPSVPDQPQVPTANLDIVNEAPCVEIETQLGGLFYLINLALYLNLYGDFTRPAASELELNIWDFVTLVGAELAPDEFDEDPIWPWLAKMSGREEGRRPGESFEPEDTWRLPREWVSTFAANQPWRWSASSSRLRVAHPEGFILLDLPLANEAHEQLRQEIEAYGISMAAVLRSQVPRLPSLRSKSVRGRALRRWLSLLMLYLRARLRTALGSESDNFAARALCRHYARVRTTDTHVDVFFNLADLPLEIRCAGLDRDPGWVPAAGRFIAFHFD